LTTPILGRGLLRTAVSNLARSRATAALSPTTARRESSFRAFLIFFSPASGRRKRCFFPMAQQLLSPPFLAMQAANGLRAGNSCGVAAPASCRPSVFERHAAALGHPFPQSSPMQPIAGQRCLDCRSFARWKDNSWHRFQQRSLSLGHSPPCPDPPPKLSHSLGLKSRFLPRRRAACSDWAWQRG